MVSAPVVNANNQRSQTNFKTIAGMKKDQDLSMDNFFKLAHFSDVPIVNEYYKSIKAIHHNGDITKGIEEFAQWQSKHSYSEQEVVEILKKQRQAHLDICDMYSNSRWVKVDIKGFYYPSLLKT